MHLLLFFQTTASQLLHIHSRATPFQCRCVAQLKATSNFLQELLHSKIKIRYYSTDPGSPFAPGSTLCEIGKQNLGPGD